MHSADQALERLNDMVSYQMYQMNQTIYDNLENSPDLLEHISDEEITAIILQNCVLTTGTAPPVSSSRQPQRADFYRV